MVESGISANVIEERGYWTAPTWQGLKDGGVHLQQSQLRVECFPALVIPQYDTAGREMYAIVRWDTPRRTSEGREVRYDTPAGVGVRIDVPPRCAPGLLDETLPLWITEGSKKADAIATRGGIAISLPGVWSWRGPNAMPDLYSIRLKGRVIYVAFDDDALVKAPVQAALTAFTAWLTTSQSADVRVIDWRRIARVAA